MVGTSTLTSGYVYRRGCAGRFTETAAQLTDPENYALFKHLKETTGTVSVTAKKDGRHEYCFSNQMSTVVDKLVRYVMCNLLQVFT